ncbi:N-terminal domain of NEFA-interacting nuclear protein NIP30-domain-containing protein [Chytridium lagenaria]|nr:N-terminal domain of NEFA-interacting nuclear protein NIP30-domain-containing protein [Chytridium lagenaria]
MNLKGISFLSRYRVERSLVNANTPNSNDHHQQHQFNLIDLPTEVFQLIAMWLHPHEAFKLHLLSKELYHLRGSVHKSISFALQNLSHIMPNPTVGTRSRKKMLRRIRWADLGVGYVSAAIHLKGFRRSTLHFLYGVSGFRESMIRDRSRMTELIAEGLLNVLQTNHGMDLTMDGFFVFRWAAGADRPLLMAEILASLERKKLRLHKSVVMKMYHTAVMAGAAKSVKALLYPSSDVHLKPWASFIAKAGIDVHMDGFKSIRTAASNGDVELFELLLAYDGSKTFTDQAARAWIEDAFSSACDNGHRKMVHQMYELEHVDVVEEILSHMGERARGYAFNHALWFAVSERKLGVVLALIDAPWTEKGMAFNSRFVSTSVVQPGTNSETPVAGSQYFGIEIDAPAKVQEYDPRPLFERLQEEREKKDAEFADKIKLGNMIKKVDEDEANFLQARDEELDRRRREQEKVVKAALNDYRALVKESRTISVPASLPSIRPALAIPSTALPAKASQSSSTSASTSRKPVLDGVIIRKRKGSEAALEKSQASPSAGAPSKTSVMESSVETKNVKPPSPKKARTEVIPIPPKATTAAAVKATPAGLSSLAAYDSDESD